MHGQVDPEVVPDVAAWGDLSIDIELPYAFETFGGRTRADVVEDFSRCVIERASELRIAPDAVFPYYVLAFKEFIEDGRFLAADAGEVFSCFLDVIEARQSTSPRNAAIVTDELRPTLLRIASAQDALDISRAIYGDLFVRAHAILSALENPEPASRASDSAAEDRTRENS